MFIFGTLPIRKGLKTQLPKKATPFVGMVALLPPTDIALQVSRADSVKMSSQERK